MKAVIYARYSRDRQRETSIEDQARNCNRFAEREGLNVVGTYDDRGITGAVAARPGYQHMLGDAASGNFDVLIVDDLSRLSRDDYEMKGLLRKFLWRGVRVVGVSDGYDSARKGHKIHAGFKGLMNEMFLDDLRDRTHRGMTGQALKGFNCGGRTFGYRNVPIEDPARKDAHGRPAVVAVKYEIDDTQAETVRQIFGWYATGHSYKWIASALNHRRIPSSRGATWAVSAVKVVLENPMYSGTLVWNRREWVKHPDTGKRTYRPRPKSEWIVTENPALRIVSQETAEAVRHRQTRNRAAYCGPAVKPLSHRYLFSGLMVCAECGGNFTIVTKQRYGCATRHTRGIGQCTNAMTVSRHIVERRILEGVKADLLHPSSLEKFKSAAVRLIEEFTAVERVSDLERRLKKAEQERENILAAIRQGILTPSTKEALETAESRIEEFTQQLSKSEPKNIARLLPRAVDRYRQAVVQLEDVLSKRVGPAREILRALLGGNVRIHRAGEHLVAEVANYAHPILAKSLDFRFDVCGCGGPLRDESFFIPLVPETHGESGRRDGKRISRPAKSAA